MRGSRINKGINLNTAHKLLETLEVYKNDVEKLFKEEAFVKFNADPIGKVKKNTFSKSEQLVKNNIGDYRLSFIDTFSNIDNFAERVEVVIIQQKDENKICNFQYIIVQEGTTVHIDINVYESKTGLVTDPDNYIDVIVIYNKVTGIEERELFIFEG